MKSFIYLLIIVIIVGLGAGGYILMKKNKKNTPVTNEVSIPPEAIDVTSSPITDTNQTFTNSDHGLSFKYPASWKTEDLGGEKNVTEPLVRENIFFIYDPIDSNKPDQKEAKATLKALRFVVEPDVKISSEDDWYQYIKGKVDNFIANKTLVDETGYQLISLEKVDEVNGRYTVYEDYTLENDVRGRDYYIYAKDLYQFIFEAKTIYFDKYTSMLEQIVGSFNVK